MKAIISRQTLAAILRESALRAPGEACGLLFGEDPAITGWQAAENVAERPETDFEIDPATLFTALKAERGGGPAIIGYWHSHPSGDASASARDAEMASADGKLWLIVAEEEVRLWRAVESGARHGRFDPVELAVE